MFAALQLVRHAGMIAVLPKSIVAKEVRRGGLTRLPLEMAAEVDSGGFVTALGSPLSDTAGPSWPRSTGA